MLEGTLAYIGIGANLKDPLAQCRKAIERLSVVSGIKMERVSSFYRTEPVIPESADREARQELENQDWFVNAAAEIRTVLSPRDLLKALQHIENSIGRVRTIRGGPRIIDLDLLLYGQEIREEEGLTVPHPEMHRRLFVLEPLCEMIGWLAERTTIRAPSALVDCESNASGPNSPSTLFLNDRSLAEYRERVRSPLVEEDARSTLLLDLSQGRVVPEHEWYYQCRLPVLRIDEA